MAGTRRSSFPHGNDDRILLAFDGDLDGVEQPGRYFFANDRFPQADANGMLPRQGRNRIFARNVWPLGPQANGLGEGFRGIAVFQLKRSAERLPDVFFVRRLLAIRPARATPAKLPMSSPKTPRPARISDGLNGQRLISGGRQVKPAADLLSLDQRGNSFLQAADIREEPSICPARGSTASPAGTCRENVVRCCLESLSDRLLESRVLQRGDLVFGQIETQADGV